MRLLKSRIFRSTLRSRQCRRWSAPIERPSPLPVTTLLDRLLERAGTFRQIVDARRDLGDPERLSLHLRERDHAHGKTAVQEQRHLTPVQLRNEDLLEACEHLSQVSREWVDVADMGVRDRL